ncbi:MAG: protein translocase subunit SecD, partial [Thermodesulfovibrionales bacterium]
KMPQWWQNTMPNRGITLGLDLQGGIHLVFEVEGDKAVATTIDRIASSLKDVLKKKNLEAEIKTEGTAILVSPNSMDIRSTVEDNYPILKPSKLSSDTATYKLSDREAARIKESATDQALETIRNRIDQFGVAEPTIQRQGANEIVIQLPGVKDPKRAISLIGKTALLEFKLLDNKASVAAELPGYIRPGEEEELLARIKDKLPEEDEILYRRMVDSETGEVTKRPFIVKKKTLMTGDSLEEARVNIDQRFNEPYVSLTFNPAGARLFEEITGQHIGKNLAIILDNYVHSAPRIKDRIAGGSAMIEGSFSMQEAKDLTIVLRAGALPAPMKMLQNLTVGPSLGRDSIEAGKTAGIISVILVVVFMIFYYRISGIIADLAMALNVILLLGAMGALNATLTLPGIAGIVLAIGMAVDSNVLMFERMREELRAGKTPRAAVDSGYDKAFLTIVDSHVTTLITAAVLFQFGTGPIKGFAVTLSLGVAINLFTALVGTKSVFDLINSKKEVKQLSI